MYRRLTGLAGAALAAASVAAPAPAAAADEPPSVLVKLDGDYSNARAKTVAARHDMKVVRTFPDIGWAEVIPTERSGVKAAAAEIPSLRRDPAVTKVDYESPDAPIEYHFTPRDPVFTNQFQDNTSTAWHFFKPNFPIAWDATQSSASVRVAVIDSEFDTDNPDLKEKLLVRYNAESGTPQYHTSDVKFKPGGAIHGSHTSGLVGASTDNGLGAGGACFDCGIMAIKIGGSSSGTFVDAKFLGDIVEALTYAGNNGASVANLSLGTTRPSQALQDAVNFATSKRVVVVASAGNSQQSNPGVANYPAAYNNVIAVAATDRDDRIGDFSTNGSFVDVSAPGVDVLSTTDVNDPEVQTFEQQAPQAAIAAKSGTSMASPIVAGLAGLMRSVRPDLTPAEVDLLLKRTARDLGASGRDPIYGAGRVEAGAAVAAARSYQRPRPATPPPPPPPPDRTGLTITKPTSFKLSRKQLRFRVSCPAGEARCRYNVTASGKQIGGKRKSAKLGKKSATLRGGQRRTIKISLSRKTRRKIRRWRRAKVTLSVRATDAAGNVSRRKFKANVRL